MDLEERKEQDHLREHEELGAQYMALESRESM
jgi:hypothetical protein